MAIKLQAAHATVRDPSDISTTLEGILRTRGITASNLKQYQLTEYGSNLFLVSIIYDGGDVTEFTKAIGTGGAPVARRRAGIIRKFTTSTRTKPVISRLSGWKRVPKALAGLASTVSSIFTIAKIAGWANTGLASVVIPIFGIARAFSVASGSASSLTYGVSKISKVTKGLNPSAARLLGGARSYSTTAGLKPTIAYSRNGS